MRRYWIGLALFAFVFMCFDGYKCAHYDIVGNVGQTTFFAVLGGLQLSIAVLSIFQLRRIRRRDQFFVDSSARLSAWMEQWDQAQRLHVVGATEPLVLGGDGSDRDVDPEPEVD
jgi:hypothetical protein